MTKTIIKSLKNLTLLLTFNFALLTCFSAFSQSGAAINTTGTAADASAMLDVSSTNSGILIPRLTKLQRSGISQPAEGLMIYQINDTTGFWYYNGTSWKQIGTASGTAILSGTSVGNTLYWNGTSWAESSNIYNAGSSVGIGTNNPEPTAKVEINSTNSGLLIPRMTTIERNAIQNPAIGLQIFNTTTMCFEYYAYNVWQQAHCAVCFTPDTAGAITGSASVCQNENSVTYTVPTILNATSYVWSYSGTGAAITGNSNTITIDFSPTAISGNLTVYGVNSCGNGIVSASYAVTVNPLPDVAGTITGSTSVCQNENNITYTVPAIANATSYIWSYSGTGAAITGNSNTITVDFSPTAISGNLTVYGVNSCGNGIVSANYAVTVNPLPDMAGTITGSTSVCQNENSVTYTVSAIANATSYVWSYSGTGAAINGNSNTITIDFSPTAISGNLTVYGVNSCGNGIVSASYAVTVNPLPDVAGTITGSTSVCQNENNITYTVPAIANATSYIWSYSGTGVVINGNTNSITVDFSQTATSGNLTVYGVNSCGNGTVSTNYSITVNSIPSSPIAANSISYQNEISWEWDDVQNAVGYQWNTNNVYPGTGVNTVLNSSYNQTNLNCNNPYVMYVWAYNNCGYSTETELADTTTACMSNACGIIIFNYKGYQVTYGTVNGNYNNGQYCWLDRNLGASAVASAVNDTTAYGDLFQWGRLDDGHQYKYSSTTTVLAISDTPGHSKFILPTASPYDWRSTPNNALWQGVSGTNNPCPSGWRLPTETELNNERASWISNDRAGAVASNMKLPAAGRRKSSTGAMENQGLVGAYWTYTVDGVQARTLSFSGSTASMAGDGHAAGRVVRCIKDY